MPCRYFSGTDDAYSQGFEDGRNGASINSTKVYSSEELAEIEKDVLMQKLDKVARLLCSVIRENESDKLFSGQYGSELKAWWGTHKLIDEERKRTAEQAEKQ